jgi:NitT/TauT family transport system substrate-binding protein
MPVDELVGILSDPAIRYTMQLEGIGPFVDFMAKTGALKSPPASWRDMFFPEALAGL